MSSARHVVFDDVEAEKAVVTFITKVKICDCFKEGNRREKIDRCESVEVGR